MILTNIMDIFSNISPQTQQHIINSKIVDLCTVIIFCLIVIISLVYVLKNVQLDVGWLNGCRVGILVVIVVMILFILISISGIVKCFVFPEEVIYDYIYIKSR